MCKVYRRANRRNNKWMSTNLKDERRATGDQRAHLKLGSDALETDFTLNQWSGN